KEKYRQSEPEKIEDLEISLRASPARDCRPGQPEEKQRRIGCEMLAEKSEQLERMKARYFVETAARLEVGQRDPGVARIPNNRRDRAKTENQKEQIKIRPAKFAAQAPDENEHEQNRYQFDCIG